MSDIKPIKVLYIIDKLTRAGAQTHLLRLLSNIDRGKFDCQAYCLIKGGEIADELRKIGIQVHILGISKIYNFAALRKLFTLIKFMKQQRFDIVHTYLFSANIYGVIAAMPAGTPTIITSRRDTGILREGKLQHILAYRITNRYVSKIVCVTNSIKEIVKKKEKVPEEKVVTVYNGVDTQRSPGHQVTRSPVKKSLGIKNDEFVVGMIANFSWIKGHRVFVDAAQEVLKERPDVKFLLIGDGELKNSIQSTVHSRQLDDKILFLGRRDDIPELLSIMDVSLNASYSEGMSNTILESMAAGVPVVATDVDGNRETVVGYPNAGYTGIFVPPGNAQKLADGIMRVLGDKEIALKMSENAKMWIARKFSTEKMVENMTNLYSELTEKKDIAFILSQFPETHETFILREMKAIKEAGVNFKIFSLKKCKDEIIHEDAKLFMRKVDYTPFIVSWKIVTSNFKTFIRNPFKYISVVLEIVVKNAQSFKYLLKSLVIFPKSIYYANEIRHLGIKHIQAHWATIPATSAYIASKFSGIPYGITAHAWDIFVKTPMLKEKLQKAKFIITCTDYNRKYLQEMLDEVTKSPSHQVTSMNGKVYLNYHGLGREWFDGTDYRPQTTDYGRFTILAIGRLVEQKGFEYLIKACGILKEKGFDFECKIVGDGPLLQRHQSQVTSHQLEDHVKILGVKTQEEIKRLYSEADIFAAPSVIAKNGDRDGIPNVMLEAMSMGIPVIGTAVSGLPEALINKKTGIVVTESNPEALSDAIEKLINDRDLRNAIAQQGRAFVFEFFHIDKNVERLTNIYEECGVLHG